MEIIFQNQDYLFLLFLIPAIIIFHFIALRARRNISLKFANFEAIARIKGIEIYSKNLLILFLVLISVLAFVLSASGFSIVRDVESSKFSFVMAIDVSSSMSAIDIQPNRLEAAKQNALSFISNLLPASRVGIISFSGNSFIVQEITDDRTKINRAINSLSISEIGGTDLSEAIITSTNMLDSEDNKVIILLSDGQANAGVIDEAVFYAADKKVIIHTIALGTSEGGEASYGISRADEEALKAISYETGGEFFSVKSKDQLVASFNEIKELKKSKQILNLATYLNLIGLAFLILTYVLTSTKYSAIP